MRHHTARITTITSLVFALAVAMLSSACVHTFTPAMMSVASMNERPAQPRQATTSNATVRPTVAVSPYANTAWTSPYRQVWVSPAYAPTYGYGYSYPTSRYYGTPRPTVYRSYGSPYYYGTPPIQHVGRRVYHRSSTVYRR
jgi:hypothetical protein